MMTTKITLKQVINIDYNTEENTPSTSLPNSGIMCSSIGPKLGTIIHKL